MATPVLPREFLEKLSFVALDIQQTRYKLNEESDTMCGTGETPERRERFEALTARAWRLAKIEDAIASLLAVEGVR